MSMMKRMYERMGELTQLLKYDVETNIYQSIYRNYNMFVREMGYRHESFLMAVIMYSITTSEENLKKIEEILALNDEKDFWLVARFDLQYGRTINGLSRYKKDNLPFKTYKFIYNILQSSINVKADGFKTKSVKNLRKEMFDLLNSTKPEYLEDFSNLLVSEAENEKELKEIKSQIMSMKLGK